MEQPFGPGTKVYSDMEVIHMLYDMESEAKYSQPYDTLNIISSQPSNGLIVNSEVINTVLPNGLRGEIFQSVGD